MALHLTRMCIIGSASGRDWISIIKPTSIARLAFQSALSSTASNVLLYNPLGMIHKEGILLPRDRSHLISDCGRVAGSCIELPVESGSSRGENLLIGKLFLLLSSQSSGLHHRSASRAAYSVQCANETTHPLVIYMCSTMKSNPNCLPGILMESLPRERLSSQYLSSDEEKVFCLIFFPSPRG